MKRVIEIRERSKNPLKKESIPNPMESRNSNELGLGGEESGDFLKGVHGRQGRTVLKKANWASVNRSTRGCPEAPR